MPGLRPVQPEKPRKKFAPPGKVTQGQSDHSLSETLSLTVRAGLPLSQLNIALLDTDTKLILAEKEQALLGTGFLRYLYNEIKMYLHFKRIKYKFSIFIMIIYIFIVQIFRLS